MDAAAAAPPVLSSSNQVPHEPNPPEVTHKLVGGPGKPTSPNTIGDSSGQPNSDVVAHHQLGGGSGKEGIVDVPPQPIPSASATPSPVATPCRAAPAAGDDGNGGGGSGSPVARPNPQQLRISPAAADARLRRTMAPSVKDGSYKVSAEIVKQYRKGGKSKQSLLKLFETCGYCKDHVYGPISP